MNRFDSCFKSEKIVLRLKRLISSRHFPYLLVFFSTLLALPTLWTGLYSDDYFHKEVLTGNHQELGISETPDRMFEFFNGDPARTQQRMEKGTAVWWTLKSLQISFFRPLTEWTHRLDYLLWPEVTELMHLHNVVWYALLIILVAAFYRKLFGDPFIGGLAAMLYALDDAHGMNVGWIAHRSALIATLLGVATLLMHVKFRRDGSRQGSIMAPILFLLGLLSAESAIATCGYLLAYELCMEDKPWRNRFLALAPYGALTLTWWMAYRYWSFGAAGSGAYLDPVGDPLLYLSEAYKRIPLLLYGQWGYPNTVFYPMLPFKILPFVWIVVVGLLAGLVTLAVPLLKENRTARFWATGMVFSLFPVAAMLSDNRLLLFVGLGAMGLLSQLLTGWFSGATWLSKNTKWRFHARNMVILLILVHCVVAPLTFPRSATGLYELTKRTARTAIESLSTQETLTEKTVVLLNPPIPVFVTDAFFDVQKSRNLTPPSEIRVLASGMHNSIRITRPHPNVLELEPEKGFLFYPFDSAFRGPNHPLEKGEKVVLSGMVATVLSTTKDNRPLKVRFSFDKTLRHQSYIFFKWSDGKFVRFVLPHVGETVSLSAV